MYVYVFNVQVIESISERLARTEVPNGDADGSPGTIELLSELRSLLHQPHVQVCTLYVSPSPVILVVTPFWATERLLGARLSLSLSICSHSHTNILLSHVLAKMVDD